MTKAKGQRNRELLSRFTANYGNDESRLDGWRRLCFDCGVVEGSSITQCKKALKSANINILDLLQAKQAGTHPCHFRNKAALREYTLRHNRVFPKALVKENVILKSLLIELF